MLADRFPSWGTLANKNSRPANADHIRQESALPMENWFSNIDTQAKIERRINDPLVSPDCSLIAAVENWAFF